MSLIGTVNSSLEALILIVVRGPEGRQQTVEARIDTGFSLYLTLPRSVVEALALPFKRKREVRLATGIVVTVHEHEARVLWDGLERPVRVIASDAQSLIGVALLHGYKLCIEISDGGDLIIEPLT